jgi:hypothetical protein
MDFYKYFTIFGKTYHITITSEDSNERVFSDITECLLKHRKLMGTKMMKENFYISLTDAKLLADNIIQVKSNVDNTYTYTFLMEGRVNIKNYLKNTLGKYERKHKN